MSDWSGKWRPALERIACMVGKGKGLPYLPSGAIPNFTDHDICHAVASTRRTVDGKINKRGEMTREPLAGCVRPEILELCYAGSVDRIPRVARAASDAITKGREKIPRHELIRARHGALIASRAIAGRNYTASEIKREAWSIACNYETLEIDIGEAKSWIEGERFEAAISFLHALKSRLDDSVNDASAYQIGVGVESRVEREALIRRKLPRVDDATVAAALAGRDVDDPEKMGDDEYQEWRREFAEGRRPMTFGVLTLKRPLTG